MRANKHIEELEAVLRAFEDRGFHRLFIEKEPKSGTNLVGMETDPLPNELALVIGDAIHNLHSALDLLAFEIVTRAGETPSRNLYFPWSRNREKLVAMLEETEIKVAPAPVVAILLDSIGPDVNGGGNNPLYAMHALDISDKHKLIIPMISEVRVSGAGARSASMYFGAFNFTMLPGAKQKLFRATGDFEVTDQGKASVTIAFNEPGVFHGEPVVPTLHGLSQIVSRIIDDVAQHYLAGG